MLFQRNRTYARRVAPGITVLLLVFAGAVHSLELKYIPVLPPVITNPSLGQIDLFGDGFGAPMFIVNLNNAGDTNTYNNLQIRYTVKMEFTDNGVERTQRLYEGITDRFSIHPNEILNVSSTEFLNSRKPDNRVALKYKVYELDDLELKDRLIASKQLPDGTLSFALELFPSVDPVVEDNSYSHTVMNSTTIDLIGPGNEISQPPADITNPRPLFTWFSQLYPGVYRTDDVFELRIYEARPGVSSSEAMARLPFFTRRVNAFNFQYPADVHPLVPGYAYYWQVTGFVKGTFTSEIRSDVYGFRLEPLTDSTAVLDPRNIDEVLEILRPVIGDMMVEQMKEYVSGEILIDDQPVSKDQLSEAVRRIILGEFTAEEPTVR